MNRSELLDLYNILAPAVSENDLVPAFGCVYVRDGALNAYNNVIGVQRKTDFPVESGGFDGNLFGAFIRRGSADDVRFEAKGGDIHMTCGRSRMKLRHQPDELFTFKFPGKTKNSTRIELTAEKAEELKQAMTLVNLSIGIDPSRVDRLGVCIEFAKGRIVLYTSDNLTASRHYVKTAVPEALIGTVVSIPPDAAKSLVKMHSALFSSFVVSKSYIVFDDEKGTRLFSRVIHQEDTGLFRSTFGLVPWNDSGLWSRVGPEFTPAIQRACMAASETVFTTIEITDGVAKFTTKGQSCTMNDRVRAKGGASGTVVVAPKLVDRMMPAITHVHVAEGLGLCLRSKNMFYIVSGIVED